VATADSVPFASTGHLAIFGVGLVEKLAGEGDDSLCGFAVGDPGAFRAGGGCVVDDGAASVGGRGGGSEALLGELLCPAICMPGKWEGLLVVVGIARVVGVDERGRGECAAF
jgi:hypothetical protein